MPWLGPDTIRRVWTDPSLLSVGLSFSVPALCILLAHELGHYLTCRRYGLPATPPYFIPAPVGLGTFGAFIRIRARFPNRRELFDVGIAGPLAGFVTLLPFLVYGVAQSRPAAIHTVSASDANALLLVPGKTLLISALTRVFHGDLAEGMVLDLHPLALAAWVGLLVTALNLLPLGQLDGGHILYALNRQWHRRLSIPLWLLLIAVGWFWRGWLLWGILVFFMGLRHPPVRDESQPLDSRRQLLAALALLIFILSFMIVPVELRTVQ